MTIERKHPAAKCEECPLYRGKYVPTAFPQGESNGLVIIGEAPGKTEAAAGEPFVGISGRVLNSLLSHYGIERERTTLTNAVLCHPRGNATPSKEAISACEPRLREDIAQAETVLALGNTAASLMLGKKTAITKDRIGPPKASPVYSGVEVVPTIHPAACLRHHDHFPHLVTDVGKIDRASRVAWKPPSYKVFDKPTQALLAIKQLMANADYDPVVIDIETGKDKDESTDHPKTVLCIGFAYAPGKAIVIGEEALRDRRVRAAILALIRAKRMIAQNGKYDFAVLSVHPDYMLNLKRPLWYDTMLASYCLDERSGVHSLDYMGIELLGTPNWKVEFKKLIKGNDYSTAPRKDLYRYNAYDCAATYDIAMMQMEQLTPELRSLHDMLVRVSDVLMQVEIAGMNTDGDKLEELNAEFEAEKAQIVKEINEHLGLEQVLGPKSKWVWPFNPASPKQVAERLQDHYKVTVPNTNEKTLYFLAEKHKKREKLIGFLELLLSHRKVAKMHGTYVKGIIRRRDDKGIIHPTFKIHGTTTGRLSCADPNVQNVPRGDKLRSIYVPHNKGNVFIQADYSNAEGRIVAVLSRSDTLAQLFREGRDVHGETATHFFGPNWTKEQRVKAKGIVHGLNYGRTAHGIAGDPAFGVDISEAEELIQKYWELCPEVLEWQQEVRSKVFDRGEDLVSVFGRRRRFMLITPDNEHDVYKEALAWEPQSTASDICLMAAVRLAESGYAVRNIVHDSILVEAGANAKAVAEHMIQVMEDTAKETFTDKVGYYVPFPCEYEIGPDWGAV